VKLTTWNTYDPFALRGQLSELERRFQLLQQELAKALAAAVGNADLADMPAFTLKGNNTGGVADPADLTVPQVKTLLAYSTADIGAQPLDGDLTSLAAAAATGAIYYRSAANTWSPVSISSPLTFSGGFLAVVVQFDDNIFRIRDNGDNTKQLAFEVSGISTASTRTVEAANADVDWTCSDAVLSEDFLTSISSATASTSGATVGMVTFINALVGTWTHLLASLDTNHPGILRLGLPATIGAAAGIIWAPHQSGGGDLFAVTFRTPAAFTNLTIKLGEFAGNTAVTTEPTDGVYLWQTAGTSTFGFKSAAAGVRTAAATGALTASTWYTAFVNYNTARTRADCTLVNDAGTVILSAALTTTLPATSAVLYGQASVSTSAAVAVAAALDIDKVAMRLGARSRKLVRPTPNTVQEFMRI
jgi:hypothetical protein